MATPVDNPSENPDRARLASHFLPDPTSTSRWDALWRQSYTPWDRRTPSPALVDLLTSRHPSLNPPVLAPPSGKELRPAQHQKIRRPRALVPGCGRGYDVLLLAAFGFDATGLDVSSTAVKEARKEVDRIEAEMNGEGRGDVNVEEGKVYEVADEKVGRGTANIVEGDFFSDTWRSLDSGPGGQRGETADGAEQAGGSTEGFDVIYDYTFLSALPTQLRSKWAARMAQLLAPSGRLICLEFPTYKDPKSGGPPWATPPKEYVALLSRPGEEVEYDEAGYVKGIDEESPHRSEKGLVRIAHFQPERTHEIGKGTDWLSIWKHQ